MAGAEPPGLLGSGRFGSTGSVVAPSRRLGAPNDSREEAIATGFSEDAGSSNAGSVSADLPFAPTSIPLAAEARTEGRCGPCDKANEVASPPSMTSGRKIRGSTPRRKYIYSFRCIEAHERSNLPRFCDLYFDKLGS